MNPPPKATASPHDAPVLVPTPPLSSLRTVGIVGSGTTVPESILSNRDLEKMVDTTDSWIVERTGMRERRIAKPGQPVSDFATGAAERALTDAGLDAADLELIIVATVTPDTMFPPTACYVQERIGATRAAGFDLSVACSGFINAVMSARALVACGTFANAIVIGAEVLSSIVDYSDRESCVLFGDGAGAVVLLPDPKSGVIIDVLARIDGSGRNLIELPAGGSAKPTSAATLAAGEHYMQIEGRRVFKFAVNAVCSSVIEILERNQLTLADLNLLIPHQANLRIIEAAATRLGLEMERVVVNIERYGNTSSASIPLALDEARRSGRIRPGDLVCLVGFGAGLSWGAALIRF